FAPLFIQYSLFEAGRLEDAGKRPRRAKRIEHLTRLNQSGHDRTTTDLPILARGRTVLLRASYAPVPRETLLWCMIPGMVLCLTSLACPASLSEWRIFPGLFGLVFLLVGSTGALILDRSAVCEITSQGISAPTGCFAITTTFVPWRDVAECELVHDDGKPVQP